MGVACAYRVLGDCVLLEPEPEVDYATRQGFTHVVVPDAYLAGPVDPPKWGHVLALGPQTTGVVRVGERVLYGKFSWAKLPLAGDAYYAIVREKDLLAVDLCPPPSA